MLDAIAWTFNKTPYTNNAIFNEQVTEYQIKIFETADKWQPTEIIIDLSQVYIQYQAWIKGKQDLLANEELTAEDLDYVTNTEPYEDEYGYQVDILAKLQADNGQHFTAIELLQKTHNQMVNKELGDHVFFEGFGEEFESHADLPIYYVGCGS
ncbi:MULTISPECIES: hypothetical protein [unclassified Moraxella]|uniref:hypothetical protein n=1 Tax=unclassified Moraxella TaxID=2685852 RepID=UPI003AF5D2DE